MKILITMVFYVSLLFANLELDKYINNKDLQSSIIKDEENRRIIVDLLYDLKNNPRLIIFTKDIKDNYQKTFDEKLYFGKVLSYSNIMIKLEKNKIIIICTVSNVDDGYYNEIYYFENYLNLNLNNKLLKIEKQYINIDDDTIKKDYIFIPKKNIPTLKNYISKGFADKYLNKNHKNFLKINYVAPIPTNLLEDFKSGKLTFVSFNELSTIIANNEINTQTLNQYNDIAYYLQQSNANDEAIFLLEKILVKFPKRTVAYLNLADAYNEKYLVQNLNNNAKYFKEKAKTNYEKYIELMKQDGKENKIPKRVLEYK